MKRRVGVVAVLVVVAVLLAVWLVRGRGGHGASSSSTASSSTGGLVAVAARAIDPAADPRLQPLGSISGTVRDEAGAPIAKARVCARATGWQLSSALTRALVCSDTDDQGRYTLGKLLAADYTVHAAARPFLPAVFAPTAGVRKPFPLAAGQARTGVDLVLRGGGVEITGVVLDITGGPIARAQVRAGISVEADDQGRFALWVAPGSIAVEASADGYADATRFGSAPGQFEIRLTPESSFAGTVVDAATAQPVAGAHVSVWMVDDGGGYAPGGNDITDAAGKFRLEGLEPGRYLAAATTEHGYGRSDGSTRVGLAQHVDGVVVKLFPARRVAGQIVNSADHTPCSNGSVSLTDRVHNRNAYLRSEPGGQLAADGVVPGTYEVTVRCEDARARDHYEPITVADSDVTGVVWEVDAGARMFGKVRTRSGDPIDGAQLWLQPVQGGLRARVTGGVGLTGADGSYQVAGLSAGRYRINVRTDRGVPRDDDTIDIPATGSIERDFVLDDGGRIAGSVVDQAGKPVADVRIMAYPLSRNLMFGDNHAKTGADGRFAIDAVRPAEYRVFATRGMDELRKPGTTDDGAQGERVTVRAGETTTVRLVVEASSGAITGSVVDAAGQPVTDAFVVSSRESDAAGAFGSSIANTRIDWWGETTPVLTSSDGGFQLTGLTQGKYTLRAHRKGGGEAIAEHVALGATVRLQIKPTGSISGTVRRDSGGPPRDLRIALMDRRTGLLRSEMFYRSEGQFRITDLPAGHFEITATGDGGRGSVTVDLADGETRTGADIALAPLVTLTGRLVEYGTQKPVTGIQVYATAAGGVPGAFQIDGEGRSISDEAGRFTVTNVPVGKIAIRGMPTDWQNTEYAMLYVARTISGTGAIDVGDVAMFKQRTKRGEPVGTLGIRFAPPAPDASLDERVYKISWIDPAGPAARTELRVGDVITSVDGAAIAGGGPGLWGALVNAPPGTRLALGTERGATVTVVLGAP